MGGEFNPETIPIMLEKFLSSQHRWVLKISLCTYKSQWSLTHICNTDKLLHNVRPFSRILFTEYSIGHPMGNLKWERLRWEDIWVCNVVSCRHSTLFVVTIIAAMLSWFSVQCSRKRIRHSEGLIFTYNWHSNIVNCHTTSRGSKSNNFIFLDVLGTSGIGCGSRDIAVLVRLSPLCYTSSPPSRIHWPKNAKNWMTRKSADLMIWPV